LGGLRRQCRKSFCQFFGTKTDKVENRGAVKIYESLTVPAAQCTLLKAKPHLSDKIPRYFEGQAAPQ
jgi:hypothetical protein